MKNRYFGKHSNKRAYENIPSEVFSSGVSSLSTILRSSFAILAALAMFYCTLFYVPAYLGSSGVARYFSDLKHEPNLKPNTKPKTVNSVKWYSPYMDLLRLRRGYFKADQILNVQYLLSEPGTLSLDIHRCGGPVIIEIIHCRIEETISLTRDNSKKGDITLSINKSGFYRISEKAKDKDGNPLSYSIIWRRQ